MTLPLAPVPFSASETPSRLFRFVVALMKRLYDAKDEHLALLGTFVLMTYVYEEFDAVPYLQIMGDPATGKTRLGETLSHLAYRARLVARMSTAAMYRVLEKERGVLIIDEQGAARKELRDVMNAGYRRSGTVLYVGFGGHLIECTCFGPKVIITPTPETDEALASRMITLVSEASRRPVERFALSKLEPEFARLKLLLSTFREDYGNRVAVEYERLGTVEGLSHRDFDIAAPLLAVAAVVDIGSDEPILPTIESFLAAHAAGRKRSKFADSQTAVLARLVLEYVDGHEPDGHRTKSASTSPLYLAGSMLNYINSVKVLEQSFSSTKALGEALGARGLIIDRLVIDVKADLTGSSYGVFRIPGRRRPRIQRTAYDLDLARARALAETT
jgi:hypothetical protein